MRLANRQLPISCARSSGALGTQCVRQQRPHSRTLLFGDILLGLADCLLDGKPVAAMETLSQACGTCVFERLATGVRTWGYGFADCFLLQHCLLLFWLIFFLHAHAPASLPIGARSWPCNASSIVYLRGWKLLEVAWCAQHSAGGMPHARRHTPRCGRRCRVFQCHHVAQSAGRRLGGVGDACSLSTDWPGCIPPRSSYLRGAALAPSVLGHLRTIGWSRASQQRP